MENSHPTKNGTPLLYDTRQKLKMAVVTGFRPLKNCHSWLSG